MVNRIKQYSAALLVAGATIGLPILTDVSGLSTHLASQSNADQRAMYVAMLSNPNYSRPGARQEYGGNVNDIAANIVYMDKYDGIRDTSARIGFDTLVGLFGLAGSTGFLARKRLRQPFG